MKNDANIRNFIEISGDSYGKSGKMRGKSGNFSGISVESIPPSRRNDGCSGGYSRSFPVVSGRFSGRFRSFSRSFPVIFPIDSDWFRLIPENHSVLFLFIPFLSISFLIPPQNHGK